MKCLYNGNVPHISRGISAIAKSTEERNHNNVYERIYTGFVEHLHKEQILRWNYEISDGNINGAEIINFELESVLYETKLEEKKNGKIWSL